MQIGLYRKAIAVFLTGLVGVLAQFAPGIADQIGPETIAVVSAAVATLFAVFVSDRFKGVPVNEAATHFINGLIDGRVVVQDDVPAAGGNQVYDPSGAPNVVDIRAKQPRQDE